jgi:hypothetical protein
MNKINQPKYHYYNCNPFKRITDDCVVRAISAATGDSWEDTIRELTEYSITTGYFLNTPECYDKYLKDVGYVKQKQPKHADGTKVRFSEFVQKFGGHAVCHCGAHHVTYVADNSTWDIWDVSNEIVGSFWVYKPEVEMVERLKW